MVLHRPVELTVLTGQVDGASSWPHPVSTRLTWSQWRGFGRDEDRQGSPLLSGISFLSLNYASDERSDAFNGFPEAPFSLRILVDETGIEPATSSSRTRRSPAGLLAYE